MLRVSLFACLMASVAVMPGYATDFVDAVSALTPEQVFNDLQSGKNTGCRGRK